jgi:diguanylate cyclase (GGDEF)-like protein
MEKTDKQTNLCLALMMPVGLFAAVWAVYHFPADKIDLGMAGLAVITVFFSSFLRIQLPRTKIHLTTSDAMVILTMLWYGGETAIVLTILETAFTSIYLRRQGLLIRPKTIVINVVVAAVTVFLTTGLVSAFFGSAPSVLEGGSLTKFVWLLAVTAGSLFLLNSLLVSVFIAARGAKSVLSVWNDYCFNAFVMYLSGAVLAGFTAKAFEQINLFLFAAVAVFFGLVYLTYRRYIDDIKRTSAQAEQAERERAEQAELHVKQLEHYVRRLEQSGEELRQSHERLRHAAYHDGLTDLPNRAYFAEAIEDILKSARPPEGCSFALLYIDLNRFKTISDSLGHAVGDAIIKMVAERLSRFTEKGYVVGRFGGEEFGVLLPEIREYRDAIYLADAITARIAEPFELEERKVFTSASIGIAFGHSGYERADDVLRDADIAMHKARDSRRRFVVFAGDMHARAVTLMQIETDLRLALDRKEFEVFYQPIVSLDDMSLAGFESLIRWNHPTRGMLSPAEFIPVSESTELIVPLTLLILSESCRQTAKWIGSHGGRELFVSVNLSGRHLDHPDLVEHIRDILEDTQLDPARLKLEITETAVMENAETAVEKLQRIKQLGVKISIDDFGTGYSSLSYLHQFPIDTLKIDRSFVNTIGASSEHGEIVRTIVCLAKALNLSVVAEGIETAGQLRELISLECDLGQGYLFSRPEPAAAIEKMLDGNESWRELRLPAISHPPTLRRPLPSRA